jgi:ABC-type transporter Mla subunit MlaD
MTSPPRDTHARLTERVTRARLELELRRSLRPLGVIAVGLLVGGLAWGYIVAHVAKVGRSHEVRFTVADATAVVAGRHEVKFKGVPAGLITKVAMVGGKPVLTAKIYDRYGPIYNDARAALRPNTALQDMYLDITNRGHAAAGRATAGRPLPESQTDTSVNVADVLAVFDPNTRHHLATLMRDLGAGLVDRGKDLDATFVKALPFIRIVSRLSGQLAERSAQTKRLVHNVATLTGELERRTTAVHALAADGGATLQALGRQAPAVEATIDALPGTLEQLDRSFTALRGVLPPVDQAVAALRPAARRLPAGLAALRRLSAEADPAVRALRPPVTQLVPLSQELRPTAASLQTALTRLRPQVPAIDHATRTVAACKLAIYGFFQWTASVLKLEDARGVAVRGDFSVGVDSASPLGLPDPNVKASKSCAPGRPLGATPGSHGGRSTP